MDSAVPLSIRASLVAQKLEAQIYRLSFERFCKAAWRQVEGGRELRWNWHMSAVCDECQRFVEGETDTNVLAINIPPRATKSTLVSVMLPAWIWTWNPGHQMLALSHDDAVVNRDADKQRQLIRSEWYQMRFGVQLRKDRSAVGNFETTQHGYRISQSIGSGMTGKGGDLILIDDPHDVQKTLTDAARSNVINAYDHRIITRSNEPGAVKIILIMQRLHEEDLCGHILANESSVRHVCIPMEFEPEHKSAYELDPRTEKGEPLDPIRFPKEAIERWHKRLGPTQAPGQLQQRPSAQGGNILKRHWWQRWPEDRVRAQPIFKLQVWDTAYSEKQQKAGTSYSACTTWHVFHNEQTGHKDACLVDAWRGRVPFDELVKKVDDKHKEQKPDQTIVELKASGISLIQVMRKKKLKVLRYTPVADKVTRAYTVQIPFSDGRIWYVDTPETRDVIDECTKFPLAATDDYVDTVTCGVRRLEQMYWVDIEDNDEDDAVMNGVGHARNRHKGRGQVSYYG